MVRRNPVSNIQKKETKQCNNYRGIFLLNIIYKIFAILLYNGLSKIFDPEIGNYQMGFRPNRSTIDNIFIARQVYEKCHEYNSDLLLLTKRCNLFKVLACSTTFFHLFLFFATFFQLHTFMLFISSKMSSFQRSLGLPTGLLDMVSIS